MLYIRNLDHYLGVDVEPVAHYEGAPVIALGVIITERNGQYFTRLIGDENLVLFIPDDSLDIAKVFSDYYFIDVNYKVHNEIKLNPYRYENNIPMNKDEKIAYGLLVQYNSDNEKWSSSIVGDQALVTNISFDCFEEAQQKFKKYLPR
ncbi:MAG TPA: hypothetical protein VHA74_01960 [Candidatus Dojkabacteria bacterium]|nr:hypothetical protein [Candidatus Dojkabacteria bacterium]